MIALALAGAIALCSAPVAAHWSETRDPAALPVKACILQTDTERYRCDRRHGCIAILRPAQ